MTILKTWFTGYLLNALLSGLIWASFGMGILVAVFSFLGSLFTIPLLFIFWSFFTADRYHKYYIITWSCIAAIFIATAGSILTIGSLEHNMRFDTLYQYREFIITPVIAGVLSILINSKSIYNYTQAHHHAKTT